MRAAKLQATAAQNDLEKAQRDLSTVRVEIRKHERVRAACTFPSLVLASP